MKWRTCVLGTGFVVFAILTVCLAIFYFGSALSERNHLVIGTCYILNYDILETPCVSSWNKWTGYSKQFIVTVKPSNTQATIISPAIESCFQLEDAQKDTYWTYDAQETHPCYYQKDTPTTVSFGTQDLADLTLPILSTCVAGGISSCFLVSLAILWTLKHWRVPKPEKLPPMSDIETVPALEEPLPHTYNPRTKDRRRPNLNPMEDMKLSALRSKAYVLQEGTGDASGADLLKEESVHTRVISRVKKLAAPSPLDPSLTGEEASMQGASTDPHLEIAPSPKAPRDSKDAVFIPRPAPLQSLPSGSRTPRAAPVVPLDMATALASPRSAGTPHSRGVTPTPQGEGTSREVSEDLTLDPTSPTLPMPKTPTSLTSPLKFLGFARSASTVEPLEQQLQSPRSRSSSKSGRTRGRSRLYTVEPFQKAADTADLSTLE